jgi:hypothetical protein
LPKGEFSIVPAFFNEPADGCLPSKSPVFDGSFPFSHYAIKVVKF